MKDENQDVESQIEILANSAGNTLYNKMLMEEYPLVSVIIPCFNCESTIEGTLDSVFAQTYRNIEIIVVDDGSTDSTAATLQSLRSRAQFPIQIISQENRGVSAARNNGMKRACGTYIAFLDADDLWVPDKLELQVAVMERSSDIVLSHTELMTIDENDIETGSLNLPKGYDGDCTNKLIYANGIGTSTVLIRRSFLSEADMFDERLVTCEDWDLWTQLSRHGPFAFLSKPLTRYRRHRKQATKARRRMMEMALRKNDKDRGRFQNVSPEIDSVLRNARFRIYETSSRRFALYGEVSQTRAAIREAQKLKGWQMAFVRVLARGYLSYALKALR